MTSKFTACCRNKLKFYVQYLNAFAFPVSHISIDEKKKQLFFELFRHMLLKFDII